MGFCTQHFQLQLEIVAGQHQLSVALISVANFVWPQTNKIRPHSAVRAEPSRAERGKMGPKLGSM